VKLNILSDSSGNDDSGPKDQSYDPSPSQINMHQYNSQFELLSGFPQLAHLQLCQKLEEGRTLCVRFES
jgi:hypothetical protein